MSLFKKKKINCIIDTDPGVDDAAAIALSLYDDVMDIKLITTVSGNLDIDTVTRNALHILEKFERTDIPVAKGASKPLVREPKDATFIHQKEGLGNYKPPKTTKKKPIKKDAVEAMYETIVQYRDNINIIALGPHTNIATLIQKHPDVIGMIDHIYTEGCSPFGWESEGKWKNYVSFNVSSDPEAFKIVVDSGIPITYIPSRIGRDVTYFSEREVNWMSRMNDVGKFLAEMYSGYWEKDYPNKRVATNDTCAVLMLRFPRLFALKRSKVMVDVNVTDQPGKTIMFAVKNGHVELIEKVNRWKLHRYFFLAIFKLRRFKFYKHKKDEEINITNSKIKKKVSLIISSEKKSLKAEK